MKLFSYNPSYVNHLSIISEAQNDDTANRFWRGFNGLLTMKQMWDLPELTKSDVLIGQIEDNPNSIVFISNYLDGVVFSLYIKKEFRQTKVARDSVRAICDYVWKWKQKKIYTELSIEDIRCERILMEEGFKKWGVQNNFCFGEDYMFYVR